MKTGAMHDGRHWQATLHEERNCCEWTLHHAAPGSPVVARGTIDVADNKYRPQLTFGQLLAADQQELLLLILDEMPELRRLV